MFERYSVISWQIDADISFNCLEYGPGTVPSSCLSQTRGPSCCHNFRSFAVSLISSDQTLWTPDCTTQELRLPQQPPELLRCCSGYSASEYMPLGPPGSLLSSGEQTLNKRVSQKRVLQKKGDRLTYVNASSICSDYFIWLVHLVLLFHPSHFTDGKSEAWGREVPCQMSHGEAQAE